MRTRSVSMCVRDGRVGNTAFASMLCIRPFAVCHQARRKRRAIPSNLVPTRARTPSLALGTKSPWARPKATPIRAHLGKRPHKNLFCSTAVIDSDSKDRNRCCGTTLQKHMRIRLSLFRRTPLPIDTSCRSAANECLVRATLQQSRCRREARRATQALLAMARKAVRIASDPLGLEPLALVARRAQMAPAPAPAQSPPAPAPAQSPPPAPAPAAERTRRRQTPRDVVRARRPQPRAAPAPAPTPTASLDARRARMAPAPRRRRRRLNRHRRASLLQQHGAPRPV